MAQALNRNVSAQETTIDTEGILQMESRYECTICYDWLKDPVITTCGHRFCTNCLTSWLKEKNPSCPLDNKPLSEKDIFPDNFTRREILQLRKPCPNINYGCQINVSPLQIGAHMLNCEYRQSITTYDCSFIKYGCKFQTNTQKSMDKHMEDDIKKHLDLLCLAFDEKQSLYCQTIETSNKLLWDPPIKENKNVNNNNNIEINNAILQHPPAHNNDELLRTLYERVVILEQRNHEQNLKIENLQQQLQKTCLLSDIQARYSDGVLIWRIQQFENKIQTMSSNSNVMYYSKDSYTSPGGYRFCARINISPKCKDFIGLHIHMMQSDNDYHLEWPFRGRIKISMIHLNLHDTQHDTIMSKPEILAFHRPTQEISPRGFGFLEYASISDIIRRGFIHLDNLTIKIQMNTV